MELKSLFLYLTTHTIVAVSICSNALDQSECMLFQSQRCQRSLKNTMVSALVAPILTETTHINVCL